MSDVFGAGADRWYNRPVATRYTGEKIGPWLTALRKQVGLSQERMAIRLSVSKNTWIAWEKGQTPVSPSMLQLICHTFGITADWQPGDPVPQPKT